MLLVTPNHLKIIISNICMAFTTVFLIYMIKDSIEEIKNINIKKIEKGEKTENEKE